MLYCLHMPDSIIREKLLFVFVQTDEKNRVCSGRYVVLLDIKSVVMLK